ncbi:TonB-dependent siderophore receptor [Phenylobacterium sp.]|uniref:TonB-dependent receptor n=1 Tax=Phenylobacterium sp. TaxID=1871053 RepID=UPI001229A76B|nr:TonB-dependent siderophore receptor [Phenylobacterium sp.]THD58132.1 MAG: TonB-dependent siderophore receptor [Phenylobacterium sp.]
MTEGTMAQDDSKPRSARLPYFAGSIAAALLFCDAAAAQEATSVVSSLTVKAQPPEGYKADEPMLSKLTEPLIDTPQMIATTTRQVMDDRAATSLTEVFRNSSGISLGAGESSWQGTNPSIRGFNARNDMYLDGMRDFGSYTRDPFDLEEVELLQGPSSILFGRGSTGGVINQVTKAPSLQGFIRAEAVGGTDAMARGVVDLDAPLPDLGTGAAARLVAMGHTQDVTDRDQVHYSREGVAPSVAFGLGTANRLTLSYFGQWEDDLPDYGLPYLRGRPAPVAQNNFYGFDSDYLRTAANVETAKFEHDFSPDITIRDQIRYADYARHWRDTEPQVSTTGLTAATPLSAITVNRALQGGTSRETFFQNQMDLLANFHTGSVEHHLAAGWEIGPESSTPTYDNGLGLPATSLLSPTRVPFSGIDFPRVRVKTTAFTVGAYLIDTLKFGDHWEVSGGARWDSFDSHYVAQFLGNTVPTLNQPTTRQDVHELDQKPSWRGSVIFKPVSYGSIYFDYSTSFNPSAESLSQIVAVRSFNTGNIGLAPEENETFELGTKWNLLTSRLQLQAAIFREEKTNAREPDPANTAFNILAGDQRVDGGEIELVGKVTDDWQVTASYTHLHGETIKTVTGGPPLGSPLFNAPDDSVALWTTYQLPMNIQVGGGLNYLSQRYASLTTTPFTSVPGYTTLDAMAKWQVTPHIRLQVNVNNLTDKFYYDQIHGFHVIPGEGRTALFTVAYTG